MEENAKKLIFSVFKIWSLSPYRLQIKFSMSLFFYLFTIVINLWHSSQQMSLQCLSTNNNYNMVFSDEDKILIKSLYLKMYTTKRLTDEFVEKIWTKHGVNKLLKNSWDTGTVDIATKRNHTTTGSFQSHSHFTKENNYTFECLIF